MNKGICFYFGYLDCSVEERVKAIKDAGFDCVITNADKKLNYQNGTIKKQVKLFKKYGLELSSLHMRYNKEDLPNFWLNNKKGAWLEKQLIKDVKLARKFGFTCVVVHLSGEANEIGYNRLRRVLKVCEKVNVPLAIENLNNQACFINTFANVKSDYLKFCYDSGHNNAFDPEFDYLSIYGDKLITLHLHDNLGKNLTTRQLNDLKRHKCSRDMHTLNKYGNIDWDIIAEKLSKINPNINLDYEVMMCYRKKETSTEVLKSVYIQACELEQKIKKCKEKF